MGHTRGFSAMAWCVAAVLVVVGCSRGEDGGDQAAPDVQPLGDPPAPEPEPEPDPEPDPEPEPEPDAEPEDEPEPTEFGIPNAVITADPENDIPDEIELEILEAYARAHALTTAAYATLDYDSDELAAAIAPPELDGVLASLEQLEAEGQHQLLPDVSTVFVRVEAYGGGVARVRHCRQFGPESGIFDSATGERVVEPTAEFQALEYQLAVEVIEGDTARWVVTDGAGVEDEDCA